MDNAIFTNLPPKVGYLDDTKMQIYSAFNMSFGSSYGMCLSDSEGRTNVWFPGSANKEDVSKIYRAFRVFDSADFSVDNDPVIPEYMITRNAQGAITATNGYLREMIQANGKYFICAVNFKGNNEIHYIATNYSGNPKNWTEYKNITNQYNVLTSAVGGTLFGCIYHPSSGALFGAGLKGTTETGRTGYLVTLACVNASNSVLYSYPVQDVSWISAQNDSNRTYRNITNYIPASTYYGGTGGVILNKHGELFVFWDTNGQCVKGGATADWRRSAQILSFNVNESSLFTNASYRVSNAIPQSYYDSNNLFYLPNSYCNGAGVVKYAYDTLMDRVIPMKTWQSQKNGPLYYLNRTDKPLSAGWGVFQNVHSENFQPPDACLWAKQMKATSILGENVYLYGISKTGGWKIVNCELVKDASHNRRFSVLAGSWIAADKTNYDFPPNTLQQCCSKVGNTGHWYAFKWSGKKVEIYTVTFKSRTGNNGKTYNDVPKWGSLVGSVDLATYPDIASGLYVPYGAIAAYNPSSNNLYVYLLRRGYRPSTIYNTESQRGVWVATINMASKSLSMGKVNGLTEVYNHGDRLMSIHPEYGTFSNPLISSNWFMPTDDTIVMTISDYIDDGGKYQGDWVFTKSGSNWNATKIPQLSTSWENCVFGYNSKFGYCVGCQNTTMGDAWVKSSKDIWGTGVEKTQTQMIGGGQYYYIEVISSGSVGLVCTIGATPIFLGGYYSLLPAQEIALYDNATNYVYIHRDPNNRLLATVEVYTEPLGKVPISGGKAYSDSSQFGRVLVAQIKTQNGYAVSQVVFPIGDGYLG